jgi:hypothetical protein
MHRMPRTCQRVGESLRIEGLDSLTLLLLLLL